MRVELLVSPGCPAWKDTEERLKEILSQLTPEATFQTIVVDSPEKAEVLKFPGSPTVRVNGLDIEPGADESLNYGLGWRTYSEESGLLSKVPPTKIIHEAIADARW